MENASERGADDETLARFARGEYITPEIDQEAFALAPRADNLYMRADTDNLLDGYVVPRCALVDHAWEDYGRLLVARGSDALAAELGRAAARMEREYRVLRQRFIRAGIAYAHMSSAQWGAILFMFVNTIRLRTLWHNARQDTLSQCPAVDMAASDFDYPASERIVGAGLQLAVTGVPLKQYSLEQLMAALRLMLAALHGVGATVAGYAEYWDALFERFAGIMSGDFPAVDAAAMSVAAATEHEALVATQRALQAWLMPSLPVSVGEVSHNARVHRASKLNATNLVEPANKRSDEQQLRLSPALPVVDGMNRVLVACLCSAECMYHTQRDRFTAAATFAAAAKKKGSAEVVAALGPLLRRAPAVMEAFLRAVATTPDTNVHRFVRDKVANDTPRANLMPGEPERFIVLTVEDALRFMATAATGIGKNMVEDPYPGEVISALRADEYMRIAEFFNEPNMFFAICEQYLAHEIVLGGAPTPIATVAERTGVLLIALTIDGFLRTQHCPDHLTLRENVTLDELEHAPSIPKSPPMTPAAALAYKGLRAGFTVVRLMRQNYLVMHMGPDRPPRVLEMPTVSAALLFWMAAAPLEEGWLHPALRPFVLEIRRATT